MVDVLFSSSEWRTITIPMKFTKDTTYKYIDGLDKTHSISYKKGDLLDKDRYSESFLSKVLGSMGLIVFEAQFNQNCIRDDGGLFSRRDFRFIDKIYDKDDGYVLYSRVRGWDLAGSTTRLSANTAGVLVSCWHRKDAPEDYHYVVEDCCVFKELGCDVLSRVISAATADGLDVVQSLPQDPASAGKFVADSYTGHPMLRDYIIHTSLESGTKSNRALPLSNKVRAGEVYLLKGGWNDEFINEFTGFPKLRLKDRVDATTRAFSHIMNNIHLDASMGMPLVGISFIK